MSGDDIRAKLDVAFSECIKELAKEVDLEDLTNVVYSWMYDRCYDIGKKSGGLVEEIVAGHRK